MNRSRLTDFEVVNLKTGETRGAMDVKQLSIFEMSKTSAPRLNNINALQKLDTECKKLIYSNYGDFYFNYYDRNLDNKYIFRFILLCSYMNYKNYIEFGNAQGEAKLVIKKDLQEILNLSKKQFYETVNYFIANKIVFEDDDGYIYINPKLCNKGKMKKSKGSGVVRIFNDAIQEIYKNATTKEHEKLGLLIKILPYIHYSMNIVCQNPSDEWQRIKPFNLTELAKTLGYSTTQKLRKSLFEITVSGEKVIMVAKIDKINMIVVNPRVYYKGNDVNSIEYLQKLFDIANGPK